MGLTVQCSGCKTFDIGISVPDGNHEAVPVHTVERVGFLVPLQDAHLLHQFKAHPRGSGKANDGRPVVWRIADAQLITVLLVPSPQHVVLGGLCPNGVLLQLFEEERTQYVVDDAHGLQLFVSGLILWRTQRSLIRQRDSQVILQQFPYSHREGKVFHLHNEVDDVATFSTAEAAPEILLGTDAE